ncbi:MAG: hypothetical protein WBG82_06795 [Parvibaculum sp.]|uniref:hypothetical protein n=1 Tax=Parvibaculum sp. TaxID=2024848 RepID=UPI003C7588D8
MTGRKRQTGARARGKACGKARGKAREWAEIRRAYEDLSIPVALTAAKAGMTPQKLVRHAANEGWRKRTARTNGAEAAEAVPTAAERSGQNLRPTKLVARLRQLIAREIEAIEGESTARRDAAEKERDARRLSSLVRSLEKLNDIRTASRSKRAKEQDKQEEDGDALRAELHRRLARLRAEEGENAVSLEPDAGGGGLAQ